MQFLRSIFIIKLCQDVRIMIFILCMLYSFASFLNNYVITFEAWVQFVINKVAPATSLDTSPQYTKTFAISAASKIPRMKVKLKAV